MRAAMSQSKLLSEVYHRILKLERTIFVLFPQTSLVKYFHCVDIYLFH
jgi:hypothetical protein